MDAPAGGDWGLDRLSVPELGVWVVGREQAHAQPRGEVAARGGAVAAQVAVYQLGARRLGQLLAFTLIDEVNTRPRNRLDMLSRTVFACPSATSGCVGIMLWLSRFSRR